MYAVECMIFSRDLAALLINQMASLNQPMMKTNIMCQQRLPDSGGTKSSLFASLRKGPSHHFRLKQQEPATLETVILLTTRAVSVQRERLNRDSTRWPAGHVLRIASSIA